jgi:uroporphyrinogen decarboxylase
MTSRERVLCALNHRQPDRVPIDLGGTFVSGVAVPAYHRLKKHLGISSPTQVIDLYQMLAEVERPVLERFGADVVSLQRVYPSVERGFHGDRWKPWELPDGTPVEVPASFHPVRDANGDWVLVKDGIPYARLPHDGFYFDLIEDSPTLDKSPGAIHLDLDQFHPHLLTDEELEAFHAHAEALCQNTDFAVVLPFEPPRQLFRGMGTGGFENWMVTLATDPDYVHALMDRMVTAWLENIRRLYQALGHRVQIFQTFDDLGTQRAPFISVKMFRELIMPYYKRAFAWIHQHTPWKVLFHSDGALYPLIPSLVEMGVDALNPIQVSAAGMDPARLKREFGGRLAFWGAACDSQRTLPFRTPADVARETEANIRILAPGGGYVCAAVHNIQAGVPPENIVALFDAARRITIP